MYRFNLKEACLLDASGELSSAARAELMAYISRNPSAREEYASILRRYEVLHALPLPEASAEERVRIPGEIKARVRRELARQKKAVRGDVLRRWAFSGVGAVAAGIILMALIVVGFRSTQSWKREQAAIALIDRVRALTGGHAATAYEQAVTAVDATIEQMEKESPMLASVQDTSLSALMEALVSMPQDPVEYDSVFGPPGS